MGEVKREQECTTADDWRHRAYHLESEWAKLKAEVAKLRAENTTLRTLVAIQPTACIYCGLTEMAKCASGFPGCARADDLMCGEDEAFKAVVAERNKLRAACAAKDAALSKALGYVDLDNDALISKCLAALKDTAGTGWIDATWAVEATVVLSAEHGYEPVLRGLLDSEASDLAGNTVLIVVKP